MQNITVSYKAISCPPPPPPPPPTCVQFKFTYHFLCYYQLKVSCETATTACSCLLELSSHVSFGLHCNFCLYHGKLIIDIQSEDRSCEYSKLCSILENLILCITVLFLNNNKINLPPLWSGFVIWGQEVSIPQVMA